MSKMADRNGNSNGHAHPSHPRGGKGLSPELVEASRAIHDSLQDHLKGRLGRGLDEFRESLEQTKVTLTSALSGQIREEFTRELNSLREEFRSQLEALREEAAASVRGAYAEAFNSLRDLIRSIPPPQVTVSVPEPRVTLSPTVEVKVPEMKVPVVHVHVPEMKVPGVTVNVPPGAAPAVNVIVPEQRAPEVTVNVPPPGPVTLTAPAPQVTVNVPPPRRLKKNITYDDLGRPVRIEEVEE